MRTYTILHGKYSFRGNKWFLNQRIALCVRLRIDYNNQSISYETTKDYKAGYESRDSVT